MKHFVILLMLFSWMNLFGEWRPFQERYYRDIPTELINKLENMGVDNSPVVNDLEGAYLNVSYKDSLDGFDFIGKKVGFLLDGRVLDKPEFFKSERNCYIKDNSEKAIPSDLYIFNETQKQESGGYDAAIVYWSKVYIPTDDVIKRLKKKK